LSQRLLSSLVISGDAVSCINTEPAVAPVHELADEIRGKRPQAELNTSVDWLYKKIEFSVNNNYWQLFV
jgi:hypothetical protein